MLSAGLSGLFMESPPAFRGRPRRPACNLISAFLVAEIKGKKSYSKMSPKIYHNRNEESKLALPVFEEVHERINFRIFIW